MADEGSWGLALIILILGSCENFRLEVRPAEDAKIILKLAEKYFPIT